MKCLRGNLRFKWFDMWVGAYWSTETRTLYVCLVPTLVIELWWGVVINHRKDPF